MKNILLIISGILIVLITLIFIVVNTLTTKVGAETTVDNKKISLVLDDQFTDDWSINAVTCEDKFTNAYDFSITCINIYKDNKNKIEVIASSTPTSPGGMFKEDEDQLVRISLLSGETLFRTNGLKPSLYDYKIWTTLYYIRNGAHNYASHGLLKNDIYIQFYVSIEDPELITEIDSIVSTLEISVEDIYRIIV
jgi:hypothetical protein